MILVYTNSDKKFEKEVTSTLSRINQKIEDNLYPLLKTVQLYHVQEQEDEGCVYQIYYNKGTDTLNNLASNLVAIRLESGVKYTEVSELGNSIRLIVITASPTVYNAISDYIFKENISWFTLNINTTELYSIEDIIITKLYSSLMYNTSILSLSSIYITNNDKLEKSAFYMLIATLVARFIESAAQCTIYYDFPLDEDMLEKCMKHLLGRAVNVNDVGKLLTYSKHL